MYKISNKNKKRKKNTYKTIQWPKKVENLNSKIECKIQIRIKFMADLEFQTNDMQIVL